MFKTIFNLVYPIWLKLTVPFRVIAWYVANWAYQLWFVSKWFLYSILNCIECGRFTAQENVLLARAMQLNQRCMIETTNELSRIRTNIDPANISQSGDIVVYNNSGPIYTSPGYYDNVRYRNSYGVRFLCYEPEFSRTKLDDLIHNLTPKVSQSNGNSHEDQDQGEVEADHTHAQAV